jgi:pseudaminic acid synthase
MKNFKINNFKFNNNSRPFVIAEISSNHQNQLSSVLRLMSEIKKAGADAVKIQTYTEDTMTINSIRKEFVIKNGLWKNYNLYKLYSEAKTPLSWHKKIFVHAKKINITCFSTVFDETSVDFLSKFNLPAYKISSFEIIDLPLIKYVAKKNKPIIISTGGANLKEIKDAIRTIKNTGNKKIIILHCISNYPSIYKNYNLKTMIDLKKKFNFHVGLSDHTPDSITSLVAAGLGATVIEKHVRLSDDNTSLDSKFSMKISEFKDFCQKIKMAWECRGIVDYKKKNEKDSSKHRRSIYVVKDIEKNEKITKHNIKRIRPGRGLLPKYFKFIIGKKVKKKLTSGIPLKFSDIKF